MEFLSELWAPILLSALLVFVASSVLHMVVPLHKGDYKKLPGEAEVLAAIRGQRVEPGAYMFPCPASMKECSSPEMIEKFEQGPVGFMIVRPSGAPAMGKSLVQWFVYTVVIGVFVAYIGWLGLQAGAEYMRVFRVTGTIAVLAYALANVPSSIWKGESWSITAKFVFDGVVYGLVTAGSFAWLWPDAGA